MPLTSLSNASYTTGPGSIKRFNMFTTAVIGGAATRIRFRSGNGDYGQESPVTIFRIISDWSGADFLIRRNRQAVRQVPGRGIGRWRSSSFSLPHNMKKVGQCRLLYCYLYLWQQNPIWESGCGDWRMMSISESD